MPRKAHDIAPLEYPRIVAGAPGRNPVTRIIRSLVPNGDERATVALFNNRVSAAHIRRWRAGVRPVPSWAIELLRQKAENAAKLITAPLQDLK